MSFQFIQVDEFCKVVTIAHLRFPTEDALVVWEWHWLDWQ